MDSQQVKRIKSHKISKEKISDVKKANAKTFLMELNITYSDSVVKRHIQLVKMHLNMLLIKNFYLGIPLIFL